METKNIEKNSWCSAYLQESGNLTFRTYHNETKKRSDSPPLLSKVLEKNVNKFELKLEDTQKAKTETNKQPKKITTAKTKKRFKFFQTKKKKPSKRRILRLYKRYKDKKSGDIEAKGIQQFFKDLEIDVLDVGALIVSWKLDAKIMGMYTKSEFVEGFLKLECDSLEKIKTKYFQIREEIENDQQIFKQFYNWVFEFGKEETEKRTMSMETAMILWEIVLKKKFKLFQNWIGFLNSKENKARVITRDTWKVFLDFIDETNNGWENYDLTSSWPLLFDQFYSYMN
ncbi:rp42 related [Anaeramoeba flamelloides]|uniref:Defective in cullin neddylation protein n=1 Tax=Anaeramoeba flamelloides TaxID=1746091 RepID=A0AAV7YME3_9EUKA|nr:rp42 related [Anaeramoeba flamelloides]